MHDQRQQQGGQVHHQPPQPLLTPLGRTDIILTIQDHPAHHGEQDPAHGEEAGLESEQRQHQGEQGPDQLGHLKVEGLNDPDTVHELEILPLLVDDKVEDSDHSHESGGHVERADQPGLAKMVIHMISNSTRSI